MQPTKDQVHATIAALQAVAEAIRELKQVPSGHLYAQLMSHFDVATYQRIIDTLKGAGVVREESHMLIWQGPKPMSAKNHNAFPKGRW